MLLCFRFRNESRLLHVHSGTKLNSGGDADANASLNAAGEERGQRRLRPATRGLGRTAESRLIGMQWRIPELGIAARWREVSRPETACASCVVAPCGNGPNRLNVAGAHDHVARVSKLDETDRQILELLHQDARMATTRMADRVGVTDRTIRNRIDRLLESGIARIGLLLHAERIGYPIVALVFIEVETGRADEVAEELVAYDAVDFVAASTGDMDIVAQICSRTNEELYSIVQHEIGRIPGVRRTRTNVLPRVFKRPADWFPSELRSGRSEAYPIRQNSHETKRISVEME
jgi:Lrp/AsnC family transcriptional regulator for asnA, asnC and gidA